jgi:hypothetical protein
MSKRKIGRKGLLRKLDELVSQITLLREPTCVMCGSKEQLGNGHLFSRRNLALRWDIRIDGNCHTQCWRHNFLHSSRDSQPYYDWFISKFGLDRWRDLHTEWQGVTIVKQFQLELLRDNLMKVLEQMKLDCEGR